MKLGVSYNFFNGHEHLPASVRSIRDEVDHVSVVWQRISNGGETIAAEAADVLSDLRAARLVDSVIHFDPDLSLRRKENELAKRRLGLRAARRAWCSHFFTMDADEFYRAREIAHAKDIVIRDGLTSTSVESFMHLRRPIYRAKDTTNCAFITRLNLTTRLGVKTYPVPNVDPSRKMSVFPARHRHFPSTDVAMYHMNLVRTDMAQKLRNSSTRNRAFLKGVAREVEAWTPGCAFDFGSKGVFMFDEVANEFGTYDPSL